jgi:integrase
MATTKAPSKRRAHGAGALRQLPSGRYQASFLGPDGVKRHGPVTYETKLDADAWLKAQARDVDRGIWQPPGQKVTAGTLGEYAERWMLTRPLRPKTKYQYRRLLDTLILPTLGSIPLDRLEPGTVRNWHAALDQTKPTWCAQGYQLLRAICRTAVEDDLLRASPCRIKGAGRAKPVHKTKTATLAELTKLTEAIPSRYRAMVQLAAWCAMREGELFELRRKDIDLEGGKVHIMRAVVKVDGTFHVGDPKTDAGKRVVAMPPHLVPLVEAHLAEHVAEDAEALLFPARQGGHMATGSLYRVYYPARLKAGRPDLRFHDLRHTGLTLFAAAGATNADLMARAGHTTMAAAMIYQHSNEDRDRLLAEQLSVFAKAGAVGLVNAGQNLRTEGDGNSPV